MVKDRGDAHQPKSMNNQHHRVRITFAVEAELRFISHLDMVRLWKRALRRAKIPLTYSQGFNPQPKMTFAAPLPLGFTSDMEITDIVLEGTMPLMELAKRLKNQLPHGLLLKEAQEVDLVLPPLPTRVSMAEYAVGPISDETETQTRIEELLGQKSIPRERRGKRYDLRPLIQELRLEKGVLLMNLCLDERGAGRPEEVLDALGVDQEGIRIHRRSLIFRFDK
jgi:radical SAM-linked protein